MDEVLNHLTNRSGGFCSPSFPVRSRFVPSPLPEANQHVMELLQLHRTDTDYFINAYLRTLQLHPDLFDALGETERSYDLESYRPGMPSVSYGQLVPDRASPPAVLRTAAEWPPLFELTLQIRDQVSGGVVLGSQTWDVRLVTQGDRLRVEWPAETGVVGMLAREGGWGLVDTVTIWHEPVRFPYQQVREATQHDEHVQHLLSQHGLLSAFIRAIRPERALALLLTSLILSHPARA